MKYNYNGNLTYEERIADVSKDIIDEYPYISKSQSYLVAALEPPITTDINDAIKFRRLFNILFVTHNKEIFNEILLLDRNISIINNGIDLLIDYFNGEKEFPNYSDIFN